jgi:hypothetical protein
MQRWSDRARQFLYDGETIEASISVGENGVVVTSHRVLAFTPEGDGANYEYVDRPNVEGVTSGSIGNPQFLEYALKGGLLGVVAVGVGFTFDFGGIISMSDVSTRGAGQVGIGGLISILQQVVSILQMLDDALLVGGLLSLVLGLGAFGMYLESRTPMVLIEVAGGEDPQVPAPKNADDEARRIERAVKMGSPGETRDVTGEPADLGQPMDVPGEPADRGERNDGTTDPVEAVEQEEATPMPPAEDDPDAAG